MSIDRTTFIGIDPGDGRQPFTYAALDSERAIQALGHGPLAEALAYAAGQSEALAAINGPLAYNLGLMAQEALRGGLDPAPKAGEWTDLRLAEYRLLMRKAPVSHTPSRGRYCPKWIQRSIEAALGLQQVGYAAYSAGTTGCGILEVQSEVGYWSMLGGIAPFQAGSLEGRLQRQLVLHDEKLPVPDPMNFFEEVTHFKLLKGVLPTKDIFSQAELNALVSAYTAWLAVNHPERVEAVDGLEEGQIWLPLRKDDIPKGL